MTTFLVTSKKYRFFGGNFNLDKQLIIFYLL